MGWAGTDLELRLEAVAMQLLGRIGAKRLTPEECRAPNQSVGNQDAGRLDSALETTGIVKVMLGGSR